MKKNNLYIIGAGGYGREIASYLNSSETLKEKFFFKGFIDDNLSALKTTNCPYQIVATLAEFKFTKDDFVILAIGNIDAKKKIVQKLKGKVSFYSFIAKNVYVGNNVKIGEGVLLCPGVKLPANIVIGDFVSINIDSRIGHDCIIGNFCSIMPNVDVGGECIIGSDVFLSTKSTILPRTSVADSTNIGTASVILKDIIEPKGTFFGNPGRRMLNK